MKVFHIHSGKTFFGISRDDCNEIWFELSVIVKINKLLFIILYRTDRLFLQLFHLNLTTSNKKQGTFFRPTDATDHQLRLSRLHVRLHPQGGKGRQGRESKRMHDNQLCRQILGCRAALEDRGNKDNNGNCCTFQFVIFFLHIIIIS